MARLQKASAIVAAALVLLQAASVQAATVSVPRQALKMLPPTPQIAAAIAKTRNEKISGLMKAGPKSKVEGELGGGETAKQAPPRVYRPQDTVRVVVELDTNSISQRTKSAGLTLSGAKPESVATWAREIEAKRAAVLKTASSKGIALKVRNTYNNAISGFSAEVTYGNIAALRATTGVKKVTIARELTPDDNFSTGTIGATNLWEGTDAYQGEGQVIAIIDTGIDYRHGELGKQSALDPNGKVIGGYNWADRNTQVLDMSGSGHGVHVAGIAAGTGEGEQQIKGVAPKAKLIAEKVFSNNPDTPSAYTDDLVAAIDDAVNPNSPYHRGVQANVLNMSLGAVSGFSDPTDPEQVAIHNAVEAGAVVAISSGNSGFSTSAYGNPYYWNQDIQAAGSPGTSLDAITVASSLNTTVTINGRELVTTIAGNAPTSANRVFQDGDGPMGAFETFGAQQFSLALASNLGCNASDFGSMVGKVALIKRGSCNFSVKVANAAAAGAEAAIIYTQNPDPDLLTMAVGGSAPIPAVMIMNSYGTELATALTAKKAVTVAFNGATVSKSINDPNGDTMASSSSWGTTPNLKLKPDVTAPGANIWSSIPNNQYASFSGTSMAAPHVAGASALIMQAHPDYSPADVKAALMNTAKQLTPKGYPYPYSPRQQGAGRIQVDKAVATNVLVTGDDQFASLSLGELTNDVHSFTLTLKNSGATPATFDLSGAVYAPGQLGADPRYLPFYQNGTQSVPLNGATLTFTEGTSVTVPGNDTVQIHGNLDLTNAESPVLADFGYFAEGFITLTSSDATVQPNLSVPFMGYVGDWAGENAPRTIDPLNDDANWAFLGMTGLYYPDPALAGNYYAMGYAYSPDPKNPIYSRDFFGINNNPADHLTVQKKAYPLLTFMRNAKQMVIDVVDDQGNVVDKVAAEENLRNIAAAEYYLGYWSWDGTKYNSATGKRAPVSEGEYTMRIKTLTDGYSANDPANWQTDAWPVWIDNTMPSFELATPLPTDGFAGGQFTLGWKNATDNGSGLWGFFAILDDQIVDYAVAAPEGSFTFNLTGKHQNMMICASDNVGNAGCLGQRSPFENHYVTALGPTTFSTNNAWVELPHSATEDVKAFGYSIGESAAVVTGADSTVKINLGSKDAEYVVTVHAYADEAGTALLQDIVYHIDLDMTPPIVRLSSPEEKRPILNTQTITVDGYLDEAHPKTKGVQYSTNDGQTWTNLTTKADGHFSFTVKYTADGRKNLMFRGEDALGNKGELARVFYVDSAAPVITTPLDSARVPANINVMVTAPIQYTLTGTAMDAAMGYYFYVNGAPQFNVGDDYNPNVAKEWSYDLGTVGGAENVVVALSARDSAGNSTERSLTFKSAGSAPLVSIQEIADAESTMKVAGKVTPKVTSVTVNGTAVSVKNGAFSATVAKSDAVVVVARTADPSLVGLEVKTDKTMLINNSLTLNTVGGAWSPNGGKLQIKFNMNLMGNVKVDLLDNTGTVVKPLFAGTKASGQQLVEWDGKGTTAALVADGTYAIRVTDDIVTMTESFVKNTVAPEKPVLADPLTQTNSKQFVLSGTAAGASKVNITVTGPSSIPAQTADVNADAFATTFTLVKNGTYTFTLVAIDAVGNKSEAVKTSVTLDATAPGAVTVTGVPKYTKADTFTASITPKEKSLIVIVQTGGPTVRPDVEVVATSTAAVKVPFDLTTLEDGKYEFDVFSVDDFGNYSTATKMSFVLDREKPVITFTSGVEDGNVASGPAGKTYTIKFKVEDPNWTTANAPRVKMGTTSLTAVYSATTKEYTIRATLKKGDNIFTFNVSDAAGNAADEVTVIVTGE